MSAAVEILGLAWSGLDQPLSCKFGPGKWVFVIGPAGSGKTRFLRTLVGLDRPLRGHARVRGKLDHAGLQPLGSRSTPQGICHSLVGRGSASATAEALSDTHLWDQRRTAVSTLSRAQRAACSLLPCLLSRPDVVVLDGVLDELDPWTFADIRARLRAFSQLGTALLVSTHRLDLPAPTDDIVALGHGKVAYAGGAGTLLREAAPSRVVVETQNQQGVRALVAPYEVTVREQPGGLILDAADAQGVAAHLLTHGYGDVKLVGVQAPHLRDVLMERFGA